MKELEAIEALPELPVEVFEHGGRLAHARRGPYVTVVYPPPVIPEPPPPPPHAKPKQQFETRTYFAQTFFPQLICTSPGDLLSGLELDPGVAAPAPSPGERIAMAGRERHYKLSALNGRRFTHPLFCVVRSGPWTAIVTETEQCTETLANQWTLAIPGIPGAALVWHGLWTDQPTLPNLTVLKNSLVLIDSQPACCPGFKWCATTQSCIPLQLDCGDSVPA